MESLADLKAIVAGLFVRREPRARMRTGSATKGAKDYDRALLAIDDDDTPATDHETDASERDRPAGRTQRAAGTPAPHDHTHDHHELQLPC